MIHIVGRCRAAAPAASRPYWQRSTAPPQLAAINNIATLAFPSINTGIYGYLIEQAAELAVATVRACLQELRRDRKRHVPLLSQPISRSIKRC